MVHRWSPFAIGEKSYDLSHLNGCNITSVRKASDDGKNPEKIIKIYLTFGYHCFTEHFGDHVFNHPLGTSDEERYFCTRRYDLSKNLRALIEDILDKNPYLGRSFFRRHERFFYVEANYEDETYRVFMKISKSNHPGSDVRIEVVSAYPEDDYSDPVASDGRFRIHRIIDAKISGENLPKRQR
ncbi:hypothetical protein [Shewanella algae]|uniref:hypothetical protein n=1 Tax=Shewanella algae TaxID=38313 RepID=UPI003007ED0A